MAKPRDYKAERLNESAERKAQRAARNRARRILKMKPGDGQQVDHKTPLSKGGGNSPVNLRAVKPKTNLTKGAKAKGG